MLSPLEDYTFSTSEIYSNYKTIVVTGACRSGKTSLANLVGTCSRVENAEEPWTAKLLTLTQGLGLFPNEKIAKEMFVAYINELFLEMIFLRRANFREGDLSCIWKQKTKEEVNERMTTLNTRADAFKYNVEKEPNLILNLTEVVPFISFLDECLKNNKFIFVYRRGLEVAEDCLGKRWFSDEQLLKPIKALPYKKIEMDSKTWNIPWWVEKDDEEKFLKLTEFDRCVYYWCQTADQGYRDVERLKAEGKCIQVNYEDLQENPRDELGRVIDFLNVKTTAMTEEALKSFSEREIKKSSSKIRNADLEKRYNELTEKIFK